MMIKKEKGTLRCQCPSSILRVASRSCQRWDACWPFLASNSGSDASSALGCPWEWLAYHPSRPSGEWQTLPHQRMDVVAPPSRTNTHLFPPVDEKSCSFVKRKKERKIKRRITVAVDVGLFRVRKAVEEFRSHPGSSANVSSHVGLVNQTRGSIIGHPAMPILCDLFCCFCASQFSWSPEGKEKKKDCERRGTNEEVEGLEVAVDDADRVEVAHAGSCFLGPEEDLVGRDVDTVLFVLWEEDVVETAAICKLADDERLATVLDSSSMHRYQARMC